MPNATFKRVRLRVVSAAVPLGGAMGFVCRPKGLMRSFSAKGPEESLFRNDEQQDEVRQVEKAVVQHRAPDAVGLAVEPALGEPEEEEREER